MTHAETVENLLAFAEGPLERELEGAVAAHVETCSACQEWLETYTTLAQGLAGDGGHPSSSVLARHVAQPHGISDVEAAFVEGHLETCPECSDDLVLVRAALRETGPTALTNSVRPWSWRPRLERHRQELIAAVLLVALAVGCVVSFGLLRRTAAARAGADGGSFVEADAAMIPGTRELFGMELEGTRVIESHSDLRISDSRVKDGARVTIRAGGGVAFGNGFSVESGASLAVEGGSSYGRSKEPI